MEVNIEFRPVSEAVDLPEDKRCLVVDDKGMFHIAVWDSRGWWQDEGSIVYDSGSAKIENVVGFCVNEYQ